ncbi:MAG TPA: hypothetical protein VN203_22570, partial [Candidatus Acidoferrum sp.]|nr:hypothetical protein [Candidatus Acidoferrum sp.]
NFIHFGFEADDGGCLYKIYLEFLDQVRKEIDNNQENCAPLLLHLGFKWDATDKSRQSITRYTLHPWIPVSEMVSRAAGMLASSRESGAAEAVEEIVRLASRKVSAHNLLYLEVTEAGNPRRSFDINMYRANLKVAELHSFLGTIARQLAVPERDFHDLYESTKTQRFGHLAGGLGRDEREFFTVYYGASRFREIEPESAAPAVIGPPPLVPRTPAQRMRIPGGQSAYLMKLIQGLGVRFGVERSVKICEHTLLADSLLLPFRRNPDPDQDGRIMNVCRRLNMPPDFLDVFRGSLPQANILLFGCEEDPPNALYSADLEFSQKLAEVASGEPEESQPFLIQMG